ncbi:MAG: MBL fold metallo-hydrolase [Bacteroidales bacterium]|nr:MBL fold metallo-hydrolase [Bacteroidales bacterium]
MKIKNFVVNGFSVNAFVISDTTGECIVIDPGFYTPDEELAFVKYIEDNNLNPVLVLNTHCHVDHILGNKFVCEKYSIPLATHADDIFILERATEMGAVFGFKVNPSPPVNRKISDGDYINFGNSKLLAIHTPGHSPGSLSFYSSEEKFLIAGDVLFAGSIGRTDLPGGSYETIISSIKNKLLVLPRDTVVYPGHGPSTDIGREYDTNPFLK